MSLYVPPPLLLLLDTPPYYCLNSPSLIHSQSSYSTSSTGSGEAILAQQAGYDRLRAGGEEGQDEQILRQEIERNVQDIEGDFQDIVGDVQEIEKPLICNEMMTKRRGNGEEMQLRNNRETTEERKIWEGK